MGRNKTFIREEVLDSAIQLFWERGYADTSLSDLEKATGVNKSGLYSEFKDKEDIYNECIKRYRDTNPAVEILERQPLGWENIETFLKANMTCKGKKGCFMSNSIREFAIIPKKSKELIGENSSIMRELFRKNIKAAGISKNVDGLTNIIMTFASGISLKLNAMKGDDLMSEVNDFIQFIKKW